MPSVQNYRISGVIEQSGSNTCVKESSCSDTGTNNKNTCCDGATRSNSGVITKVKSHGDARNSVNDN